MGLAGLMLATGCAGTTTLDERRALLEPWIKVVKPEGDARFPVVLLFHGCGGLVGDEGPREIMLNYAHAAVAAGWATAIIDSFGPRDIDYKSAIGTVCSGLRLRGPRRAGDVFAAIDWARDQPWADSRKLVVAGWSHGGWTIMEAMITDPRTNSTPGIKDLPDDILDGLLAVYLTYPYCGFPARTRDAAWAKAVPGSLLVAGNDTVSKPEPCAKAFATIREGGVDLDISIYEGATHAFDEADPADGSSSVYDPEATTRAHARFAGFLRRLIVEGKYD